MAKKLNLSGVKEFLFNHGEKVALGACASSSPSSWEA